MAAVAGARALRTAAQVAHQATSAALEYVLGDVVVAGPREAAGVVRAEDVQGRLVGARAQREDETREEEVAAVRSAVPAHAQRVLEESESGLVGADVHGVHEGRVAVGALVGEQLT